MSQTKGQDKIREKQLNKVEMDNIPEKELRIMRVKMIQDLRKRSENIQEMSTKDLKSKQTEMNSTLLSCSVMSEQYSRGNQ